MKRQKPFMKPPKSSLIPNLLMAMAGLTALFLSGCTSSLPDGLSDSAVNGSECSICHGSSDNAAPPLSVNKSTLTTDIAVGAHQSHMKGGVIRSSLPCDSCHTVPATVNDPGHILQQPARVVWSALASTGGLIPEWNRTTGTCSSVYCHGATLPGGTLKNPSWTTVDGSQAACGTCHGNPPPPPHTTNTNCYSCHIETVNVTGEINRAGGNHINGTIEYKENPHPVNWNTAETHGYAFYDDPSNCKTCHGTNLDGGTSGLSCSTCHTGGVSWLTNCTYCHGGVDNATGAPPFGVRGESSIAQTSVGAHTLHMNGGTIRSGVECGSCHTVPASALQSGHITGAPARITWSALAASGGATPSYDSGSGTCTSVYCHGATLQGGTSKNPVWTVISAGPPACGSCHGNPPPPPHDTGTDCSTCHPQTVSATGEIILSGGHHINGVIESTSGYHPDGWDAATVHGYAFFDTPADCKSCHGTNLDGGTSGQSCDTCHTGGTAWRTNCTYCHGGRDNTTGAPPSGLHGETAVSSHNVGAHTTHVTVSPSHTAFDCTICHIKPTSVTSPGHLDGIPGATLTFSSLAGSSAAYNTTNATCSSLYCHGNGRTVSGSVSWTSSTALTCGSCHGYYGSSSSLSGHHATHIGEGYTCSTCHKTVVNSSNTIIDKIAHINGVKNVSLTTGTYNSTTRTCSSLSCHGSETW